MGKAGRFAHILWPLLAGKYSGIRYFVAAMENFDFVVIGGGSAGYAAAASAARLGLKTACIEGGKEIGGLCILRGCMPSKTLIESANRFLTLRRAEEFGLSAGHVAFDSGAIIRRKRELIAGFARYRVEQLTAGTFEFIRGRAEFVDPHRLKVKLMDGSEQQIEGKTFLISTGSVLNLIDLPGLEQTGYLHSDTALDSDRFPRSVTILGGGAIAIEFAHFYNALGIEVTILQRSRQLIKGADTDIAEALTAAFRQRGIRVICGTKLIGLERTANGKGIWYEWDGKKQFAETEEIFYALGRKPAVQGLCLERAGVAMSNHNSIHVNDTLQTSQLHIYAAGDVTGLYEIVHIAIQQGELAAQNAKRLLEGKEQAAMDYRLKMAVMFPEPQIAIVGLSEREAVKQGLEIRIARYPFHDHGKSMIRGEVEGFVKLIVDAKDGKIIGGAVIGPEASELIHEIAVAMHFRATAATLASIPHYHPTLSEIWTYPAEELARAGASLQPQIPADS
jgi:pyruvate/2-oxoglutarate dehydrogenase complex dihydrolipoamide dehydrogenase (E3) component